MNVANKAERSGKVIQSDTVRRRTVERLATATNRKDGVIKMKAKIKKDVYANYLDCGTYVFVQAEVDDTDYVLVATGESAEYLADYGRPGDTVEIKESGDLSDHPEEAQAKCREYEWYWKAQPLLCKVQVPVAA